MKNLSIKNGEVVTIGDIPTYTYPDFYTYVIELFQDKTCHCVNYFGYPSKDKLKCICCIANDNTENIELLSYELTDAGKHPLPSLTARLQEFHFYERELHEN